MSTIDNAPPVTRRDFCSQACHLAAIVAVGGLASACGGGDTGTSPSGGSLPAISTVGGTLSGGRVSVTVAGTPLATTGSAALVQAGGNRYLAYRSGDQTFSVVSATCTHEACTVSGYQNATYECPCHGAQYNTDGAVTRGPASRPLTRYTSQFADGVLSWSV